MGRRVWRDDEAVSEVVGTVLLVAISILLFSGLSLVVWQQMQTSPLPANVDLRTEVDGEWVSVTHTWGESVPVADTRFLVTVGGTRFDYRLDEAPLAGNLDHEPSGSPDHWDLGETLWLACPSGEACALPGQKPDSVTSVDRRANAVISSTLPGVTQGLILNPLPDLVVATEPVVDLTPSDGMYTDCTYRFRAIVANTGFEPVPDGSTIVWEFYLDGALVHTDSRSGPLPVGSTFAVEYETAVSGAGSHTLEAVVDPAPGTIDEIAGDNPDFAANTHQRSFSLIAGETDPNFAYEDVNDDGVYNPCIDVNNHTAIIDGVHGTPVGSGIGIVIPSSVGNISVAGPISFTPDGSLAIGVNLSATGSNGVTLDAKNRVTFLGSPTITATGLIDIDAGAEIDASGVTFVAEGFPVTVDSSAGSILADGVSVPVGASADATRFEIRALGYITAKNAVVTVQNGILIQASGASGADSLLLQNASLVANPGSDIISGKAIRLNGEGDVHVEGAFIKTQQDLIGVQVSSSSPSSNTFFFENLDCDTLAGAENKVVLTPLGANRDDGAGAQCTVV